ncbi:MAG: mycothiol system anti-sigma-R factor [Nocardioides sp.]|nr:mycothiol system anti-sigma-R factor [Nocardioides sp.]
MADEHESHESTPGECADFLEQIVFLLDNELEQDKAAAVRAHLKSCHPCLERYDVQRTVKAVVARSCLETAPGTLRSRIMVQIHELRVEES